MTFKKNKYEPTYSQKENSKKVIRESILNGYWYPKNKEKIFEKINEINLNLEKSNSYSSNTTEKNYESSKKIKALIVPHAGWDFSGDVSFAAYKKIKEQNHKFRNVYIIGPSHNFSFENAAVSSHTHYKTPLGEIKINSKVVSELRNHTNLFSSKNKIHENEHSIEIQLPFLQYATTDFQLVPIIIGNLTSKENLKKIAEKIKNTWDEEKDLIIISSDFIHFGKNFDFKPFNIRIKENLRTLDFEAIKRILKFEAEDFLQYTEEKKLTICGKFPIFILLNILKETKNKSSLIKYLTSGDITNDFEHNVSYASIYFQSSPFKNYIKTHEQEILNFSRKYLENLAKNKQESTKRKVYLPKNPLIDFKSNQKNSKEKQFATFVTLKKRNNLRGCMGSIVSVEETYKNLEKNIENAAFKDPRFIPVSVEDLQDINMELSFLSPPKNVSYSNLTTLFDKIVPGIHGVIIEKNGFSATFLPQVWSDLKTHDEFFSNLCLKAGLKEFEYKEENLDVKTYEIFSIKE